MSDTRTVPRTRAGDGRRLRRLGALAAIIALAVAACGTNEGGGSAAPGASASQAPAVSPAAELSGDLTVWAMGNEGVNLQSLADAFMTENPGVKVSVTPVDWGQAVAKLQTGDRRQPDA